MTNVALSVAALAAIGFVVLAIGDAPAAITGWVAAVAFAALAAAAGSAARGLRAPGNVLELRHPRGPSAAQTLPDDIVSRSGVFGRMWGTVVAAFVGLGIVPFVALGRRPVTREAYWSSGQRLVTAQGRPLRPDDLIVGAVETVFPDGQIGKPMSATLVLRLQDGLLPNIAGRADWVSSGNVAFSKICTHAGCPVAIYRQTSYQLYCPCHQSVFDVLNAAHPVAGPATRALPQLPLAVDSDGFLIARGDFSGPVGPDEWSRPV